MTEDRTAEYRRAHTYIEESRRMPNKDQDEIDAMHLVAETVVPPYRAVLAWMRRLAAVANAESDREAERLWNGIIEATNESREAMDGVFRAAQLLRDSEVITDVEAAWVFSELYEAHAWPFLGQLGLRAQTELEAGFYEARGEARLAAAYRAHPEACWAEWEEGRCTLVEDVRGVDTRLGAPPDPAKVDGFVGALEECFNADTACWDGASLRHLASEISHAEVTAAVRAAQECRARGALPRPEAGQFLMRLIGPVVLGMCQSDRPWRQLTAEMLGCVRDVRSAKTGEKTRRLWKMHAQLARCRARREGRMWAYCFRVFGEHELAAVMVAASVVRVLGPPGSAA